MPSRPEDTEDQDLTPWQRQAEPYWMQDIRAAVAKIDAQRMSARAARAQEEIRRAEEAP